MSPHQVPYKATVYTRVDLFYLYIENLPADRAALPQATFIRVSTPT
jgi:hypothetical protein